MSSTLEIAQNYYCDIESYFAGTLSHEGLIRMLVGMLNDGIGWKLTGELRDERDRWLGCGEIVGVIQNVWDEVSDRIDPVCMEKIYMTGADAALLKEAA